MELIFHEDGLIVKTLSAPEETEAAFRLRYEVFAMELGWVEGSADGREVDAYDAFSDFIGVFDPCGTIIGHLRITPSPHPFMLEKEFRALLPEGAEISKGRDVAEITRLCVKKGSRSMLSASSVAALLYKGLYCWNNTAGMRYSLMVVDLRCYRHLRMTGLPVEALGSFIIMPDGVRAGACSLDWRAFEKEAAARKPGFLEWMTRLPAPGASRSLSHALY